MKQMRQIARQKMPDNCKKCQTGWINVKVEAQSTHDFKNAKKMFANTI